MVHINRIIVLKAVQPTLEALLAAKCMSEEVYERQKQREREEKEKQIEREEKQKKIAGLTQRLSDPNLEPEKRRKFQDMLDDLQFGSS